MTPRNLLILPSFFYSNWWWDKDEEIHVPPIGISCVSSILHNIGVDHDVLYMDLEYYDTMEALKKKAYSLMGTSQSKEFEWENYPFCDEYFKYKLNESLSVEPTDWFNKVYRNLVDQVVQEALNYDYVFISMYDTTTPTGWYISRRIKELDSKIVVVWGGFNTLFLYKLLYNNPNTKRYSYDDLVLKNHRLEFENICDYVFFGESDEDIRHFFTTRVGSFYVPQILSEVVVDGSIPADLNKLPILTFEHFRTSDFTGLMSYLSRGCPYRCSFCDLTSWFKEFRTRSVDLVVEELEQNIDLYGLDKIAFADPTITGSPTLLVNLLEKIHSMNTHSGDLGVAITSQATPCTWNEQLTEVCYDTETIHSLYLGIENTENETRYAMNKGGRLSYGDVLDKLKMMKDAGIKLGSFWMVGYPGEQLHDLDKLREALRYCDSATVAIYNMGWYGKLALGDFDNYVSKIDVFETISPEDFAQYHYVFSDLLGLNMGFRYKISMKELVHRFNRLTRVINEELG